MKKFPDPIHAVYLKIRRQMRTKYHRHTKSSAREAARAVVRQQDKSA